MCTKSPIPLSHTRHTGWETTNALQKHAERRDNCLPSAATKPLHQAGSLGSHLQESVQIKYLQLSHLRIEGPVSQTRRDAVPCGTRVSHVGGQGHLDE